MAVTTTGYGPPLGDNTVGGPADHGALTGLDDDDHSQYPLLVGRSGGQTLDGDIASGGNLTLQSTAHATKGKIVFGTSAYDEANNRLGIGTTSPTSTLQVNNGSNNTDIRLDSTDAAQTGFVQLQIRTNSTSLGTLRVNATSFSSTGADKAGCTKLASVNAGGLSLAGAIANADVRLYAGGQTDAKEFLTVKASGDIVTGLGVGALATAATAGWFFLGTCAGTPTGTPAASYTGRLPVVLDSTNVALYAYTGSAWVALTTVGGSMRTITAGEALSAANIVRISAGTAVKALADTSAHSSGIVGVTLASVSNGATATVAYSDYVTVKFDADPTAGDLAYLSPTNAGQATTTVPAMAVTNQKLRLGYVLSATGGGTGLAVVAWHPELLPTTSDGVAP